jgi:pimeloyl-ACP methyl ester carboxylesterase
VSIKPGFHSLHPDEAFNYLMNRLAWNIPPEDLVAVGSRITTVADWVAEMTDAAVQAEAEGQLIQAADYWRGAEFYMPSGMPGKTEAYARFVELHDRARPELAACRRSVEFDGGELPVIDLAQEGPMRGTVIAHSGFDGTAEEMCVALSAIPAAGYRLLIVEGPGQGKALRSSGLHMSHDWDVPIGALLDHFGIDDCTLIGMSLGGYLAVRAAAFESRITRVVAWGAMYDFFACLGRGVGAEGFRVLTELINNGADADVNALVSAAGETNKTAKWAIDHGTHVSGTNDAFEFFRWAQKMHLRDASPLVEQDTLLVMGNNDHLVPLEQLHEQARALTKARSLTIRVMTPAEHGAEHCQIGNPHLVADVIIRWLDGLEHRDKALAE